MKFVVIDSNYFISKLELIKTFLNLADEQTIVVIPFAVIQELDGLTKSTTVGPQARLATNYLLLELGGNRNPNLIAQRRDQIVQNQIIMDDQILDCCLFFKPQGSVFLLSDDKNLRLKAVIHGIETPVNLTPSELVKHEVMMDIDSDHEQYSPSVDILVDMHQILVSINDLIMTHITPAFYKIVKDHNGIDCRPEPGDLYELLVMIQDEYQKAIPPNCFSNPYFKFHQLKVFASDIVRSLRQKTCRFTRGDLKSFCRDFRECFGVLDLLSRNRDTVEGIFNDLMDALD